ncbi:MAG: hypothetical protein PHP45_10915 [Elusimicrobiales bacterium]|nr:hypothetical protein [Elusimicrobiales bacterium]
MDGWMAFAAAIMLSALFAGGNLAYAKEGSCSKDAVQKEKKDSKQAADPNKGFKRLKESIRKSWKGDLNNLANLDKYLTNPKGKLTPEQQRYALAQWHHNKGKDVKDSDVSKPSKESMEFASKAMKDAGEYPSAREMAKTKPARSGTPDWDEVSNRNNPYHKAPPEVGQPKEVSYDKTEKPSLTKHEEEEAAVCEYPARLCQ